MKLTKEQKKEAMDINAGVLIYKSVLKAHFNSIKNLDITIEQKLKILEAIINDGEKS